MRHLRALARAGLTHVHLLPAFDIATRGRGQVAVAATRGDLSGFPPDSEEQQAAVGGGRDQDGFNWGYDPWHYTVPEGQLRHATPTARRASSSSARWCRASTDLGLRVVMDVVYNHTTAAGQNDKSVLDRVVPGYYHRLNADGDVETQHLLPEHGHRAPDDGEAARGLGADLGEATTRWTASASTSWATT